MQAIFERIRALNFTRCCARIRQVDAFATVSDSIVIQVSMCVECIVCQIELLSFELPLFLFCDDLQMLRIMLLYHKPLAFVLFAQVCGELSNNGEPLRPFVQTFVLVPQVSTIQLPRIALLAMLHECETWLHATCMLYVGVLYRAKRNTTCTMTYSATRTSSLSQSQQSLVSVGVFVCAFAQPIHFSKRILLA